jgi:hypothetical protein
MRSSLGIKGLGETWLRLGDPVYNWDGVRWDGGRMHLPWAWSKGKVFTVDPGGDVKMIVAEGGVVSISLSPVS